MGATARPTARSAAAPRRFDEIVCTCFEMAQLCVSESHWFAIERLAERRVLDWKVKCEEKGRRVGFLLKNEEYREKELKFADEDDDDPMKGGGELEIKGEKGAL